VRRRSSLGQGLVEYALLLSLIAIIAIGSLLFLGRNVQKDLSNVGTKIAVPVGNGGNNGGNNGGGNNGGGNNGGNNGGNGNGGNGGGNGNGGNGNGNGGGNGGGNGH
jgi:Flp pilus assembly pilin Flp